MKVKDICNLQNGRAFKPDDWGTEGLPIIRIQNLNDEEAPFNYYAGEYSPVHEVNNGELLFSWSGTPGTSFGAFRWYRGKGVLNQHIFRVIPKIKVDKEYLKYALNGNITTIISKAHGGVGLQHITKKELDEIEIPIVSEQKQKEIITFLQKTEKVIVYRKKELRKLDELIKARFVEMFGNPEDNPFGWDKKPLSNVIVNANNGMARRGCNEDGNIVMRLVELQDGYIDYSNPNRIMLNDNEKKRYLLKDNDFLFARVNGNPDNVGRCAVFHDIGEDVYHNDHIIRVHFDESVLNGAFASALFNSEYGKRQLKGQIKTSAGQYTVSQDGIGAIISVFPPIYLQEQFDVFCKQVDKSKVAIQTALDETKLLLDSLMQEYFG